MAGRAIVYRMYFVITLDLKSKPLPLSLKLHMGCLETDLVKPSLLGYFDTFGGNAGMSGIKGSLVSLTPPGQGFCSIEGILI